MRKSKVVLLVIALVLLAVSIGATVAYLIASSNSVENTFTVGNVRITLTETSGSQYQLIPGTEILKDPTVTVEAGSDECWLFVKVEKSTDLEQYCEFEIQDGWTALPGYRDIYYRQVEKTSQPAAFSVLKDNRVYVKATITEEDLKIITHYPTLSVTAYAVQSQGVATAQDAWLILNQ